MSAMKTTCDACGDKLGKAIAVSECKPNSRYLCVECACASRPDELRETAEDIHRRQGHIRVSPSIGPVISHKLVAAKAKMGRAGYTIDTACGNELDAVLAEKGHRPRERRETDTAYRASFVGACVNARSAARPITVSVLTAALLELDHQDEALRAAEFCETNYRRCLSKILGRVTPAQHRAAENRASAILSVVRWAK